MAMKPKNIKELQARSRELRVRRIGKDTFAVESANNPNGNHVVTVRFSRNGIVHTRCSCEWARHRGVACVHVMAALDYLADLKGRKLSFWLTEQDARRQKNRVFYLDTGTGIQDGVWITSRGEHKQSA